MSLLRSSRLFIPFLLLATTFFTCQDPDDLGIELQQSNKAGVFVVDSFDVDISTVLIDDSIVSGGGTIMLTGGYTDPELGVVATKSFFQLILPENDVIFEGATQTLDSLMLHLRFNYYYADTTTPITINVHRVTEEILSDTLYTTDEVTYDPTPLGSFTFIPADTHRISIKLDDVFGQEILDQSGLNGLSSQPEFEQNFINGLALVSSSTNSVIGVDILSPQTEMELFYTGDTATSFSFLTNSESERFNNISVNRTSTLVHQLQLPHDELSLVKNYIQAGGGLVTKLNIPSVTKFFANNPNIAINLAELEVQLDVDDLYRPPGTVFAYQMNNNNETSGNLISGANYDSDKENYIIILTDYYQDILSELKQNTSLQISAASAGITVNRAVINNLPTNNDSPIKLRLYYTKF